MSEGLAFKAIIHRISTTVDGGIRVQLDIPETDSQVAKELLDLRGSVLSVGIVPE